MMKVVKGVGRPAEAEPIRLQVIAKAPDRTVAYLNLADVSWELGKQAAAKAHYQKYLDSSVPMSAPRRPSEYFSD